MAIDERNAGTSRDAVDPHSVSLAHIARELPAATMSGVQKILGAVRTHLGMDVAFVSQFVGQQRYFRNVDAKGRSPLMAGDARPLQDSYCQRVVDGLLPELIVDTARVPGAMALPDTSALPIGSHLCVPIRLESGQVYGTFSCFNFATDPTLNVRDLQFLRAFAEVAAFHIDRELEAAASRTEKGGNIAAALERRQPSMLYQPLISLDRMQVVGIECLARFDLNPYRGPELWFAEAAEVGQGMTLELQAIRNGLDGLIDRNIPKHLRIWLNTSASTVIGCDMSEHFQGFAPERIVLELTEHDHVGDYASLDRALEPLREKGVSVAIDDAGAGYSSMSHILNLSPDHIKLDLNLTRNIDVDRKRRALAAALIEFGRQTDCKIVAEGVESAAELNELRRLGVQMAQGFFLCEPIVAEAVAETIEAFAARND